MGCENIEASQVTACLRSASVESILAFQSTINDTNSWWPVINNAQLSYQPIDYVFNGDYNQVRAKIICEKKSAAVWYPKHLLMIFGVVQVPVLLGCNTNEGWIFAMGLTPPPVSLSEYEQFLNEVFGGFAPEVIAEYPLADYNDSGFDAINAIIGDSLFVCPAQFLAQALNTPENTLPSYMYLFNCTPSWKIPAAGAYHGAEVIIHFFHLYH
jgi:carboxylesterase type B